MSPRDIIICATLGLTILAGTATNDDTAADQTVSDDARAAPFEVAQAEQAEARQQHASAYIPPRRKHGSVDGEVR